MLCSGLFDYKFFLICGGVLMLNLIIIVVIKKKNVQPNPCDEMCWVGLDFFNLS